MRDEIALARPTRQLIKGRESHKITDKRTTGDICRLVNLAGHKE